MLRMCQEFSWRGGASKFVRTDLAVVLDDRKRGFPDKNASKALRLSVAFLSPLLRDIPYKKSIIKGSGGGAICAFDAGVNGAINTVRQVTKINVTPTGLVTSIAGICVSL